MPALSKSKHQLLLSSGQHVYLQFCLLDMLNNVYYANQHAGFQIHGKKQTFQAYVTELVKSNHDEVNTSFTLGGVAYPLVLKKKEKNKWVIHVQAGAQSKTVPFQALNEYQPEDFISLLTQFDIEAQQTSSGKLTFSVTGQIYEKALTLGGIGKDGKEKIPLYQLHLNNLFNILQRLQDEDANPHLLIAMATGSGKSFTQALWYLILYIADMPCIFSTPKSQLANQLLRDFQRLLPEDLVAPIQLDEKEDEIYSNDAPLPRWMMTTHHNVLKKYWPRLSKTATDTHDTYLCFDEQHDAAKEELLNKRIAKLAKHYPMMFLSATPTQDAYALAGSPSASLSRQEKEAMNIAKPALSSVGKAEKRIGMKAKKHSNLGLLDRLILKFISSIEKERLSPVHEYVDRCETAVAFRPHTDPYFYHPVAEASDEKNIRHFLRWNVQCPVAEKALILMTGHDSVINYARLQTHSSHDYPYQNGNLVPRDHAYNFFSLPNVDRQLIRDYEAAKNELRCTTIVKHLQCFFPNIPESFLKSRVQAEMTLTQEKEFVAYRVIHGIIENTLMFLTDLDSIQLDNARFNQPESLYQHIIKRLEELEKNESALKNEIVNWFNKNLPLSISAEFAEGVLHVLKLLRESGPYSDRQISLIQNWSMDPQINLLHHIHLGSKTLRGLAEKYKTIFWIKGLESSPSSIDSKRAFFNVECNTYDMDDERIRSNPALRHPYSTLEALDDTTKQHVFTPIYCDLDEKTIDVLFQRNLIGSYITSEKVTGFNDPNLHHVSMVLDTYDDPINAPAQIIQGSGRNRGLNPVRQPFFFLNRKKGESVSFSPDLLDKKDYYPDFFTATEKRNNNLSLTLGKKMARALRFWVEESMNTLGEIDSEKMNAAIHKLILDEFETVYNNNAHNYKKAKAVFSNVLEDVYKHLYEECEQFKKAYGMSLAATIIAVILYVISTIYYKLASLGSYRRFKQASQEVIANKEAHKKEALYVHIVNKYAYSELLTLGIPAKRFNALIKENLQKTIDFYREEIKRVPENYLQLELIRALQEKCRATLNALGTENQKKALPLIQDTHLFIKIMKVFATGETPSLEAFKEILPVNLLNEGLSGLGFLYSRLGSKIQLPDLSQQLDPNKARGLLAQSFKVYLESPFLKRFMHQILNPLSDSQLELLLDTLYPTGQVISNKMKLKHLREFKEDLAQLEAQALFAKYGQFTEVSLEAIEKTSIHQMFQWLEAIYFEILHCKCHFHGMDEKGEQAAWSRNTKQPKLLTAHSIWNHTTEVSGSILSSIAKKTKFIYAAKSALPGLSEVEALANKRAAKQLKRIAEHSISPTLRYFQNKSPLSPKQHVDMNDQLLRHAATKLGEAVNAGASFSDVEVDNSDMKEMNAIEVIKTRLTRSQ